MPSSHEQTKPRKVNFLTLVNCLYKVILAALTSQKGRWISLRDLRAHFNNYPQLVVVSRTEHLKAWSSPASRLNTKGATRCMSRTRIRPRVSLVWSSKSCVANGRVARSNSTALLLLLEVPSLPHQRSAWRYNNNGKVAPWPRKQ